VSLGSWALNLWMSRTVAAQTASNAERRSWRDRRRDVRGVQRGGGCDHRDIDEPHGEGEKDLGLRK
jgi:hypothetical protein